MLKPWRSPLQENSDSYEDREIIVTTFDALLMQHF